MMAMLQYLSHNRIHSSFVNEAEILQIYASYDYIRYII